MLIWMGYGSEFFLSNVLYRNGGVAAVLSTVGGGGVPGYNGPSTSVDANVNGL